MDEKKPASLADAINPETVNEIAGALGVALSAIIQHIQADHKTDIRPIDIMTGLTCFVEGSMGKLFKLTPEAGEREQKMIRGALVEMIHAAMFIDGGKENLKKWN